MQNSYKLCALDVMAYTVSSFYFKRKKENIRLSNYTCCRYSSQCKCKTIGKLTKTKLKIELNELDTCVSRTDKDNVMMILIEHYVKQLGIEFRLSTIPSRQNTHSNAHTHEYRQNTFQPIECGTKTTEGGSCTETDIGMDN